MPNGMSWHDCCTEAVKKINPCGILFITNPCMVARWNIKFWVDEKFPHLNPLLAQGLKCEPKLFRIFLEAKSKLNGFCLENIKKLYWELAKDFIQDTLLPELLEQVNKEAAKRENNKIRNLPMQSFGSNLG